MSTAARPADKKSTWGNDMDPEHIQAIAERDQLWSSLRSLLPEIEQLAQGRLADSERERQLIVLLARIVVEELRFRAEETE
jgi:hypothetical protein